MQKNLLLGFLFIFVVIAITFIFLSLETQKNYVTHETSITTLSFQKINAAPVLLILRVFF